jgi:Protein of unknown function (DUF1569)
MQILDASSTPVLLSRLDRLRPDSPALWGKMNAHQMICHLNDAYGGMMGGHTLSPAQTFLNRTLVRWVALHTSMRWPKGVQTRPEADQLIGGTRPVEFATDRLKLASLIETFAAQPRTFTFVPHPMFGELTEWEWMRWGYLHADHHFRQFGV